MSTEELLVTQVATNLDEVWDNFDPSLAVDPNSEFYVPRDDDQLHGLYFALRKSKANTYFKGFLCGHGGSGKTTELKQLAKRQELVKRFLPIHLSVRNFGDTADLTHDALFVEVGLALIEAGKKYGIAPNYSQRLEEWGRTVTRTFLKQEATEADAGAKGNAWLVYFKIALKVRSNWKIEEKQRFEPKVNELITLINEIAQDLHNCAKRQPLVLVDDLEKGDSKSHRDMHLRLFNDHYDALVQPRIAIIYTIPVYFRALPNNRISKEQLYTFAAARLYALTDKAQIHPPLDRENSGYQLMHGFIKNRVDKVEHYFDDGALDALILIGGGLFRETARAIRLATQRAIMAGEASVSPNHVAAAGQQIRKDYQPMIRSAAVNIFKTVLESDAGWVDGVEPYLQSRAIVEYENGDVWLDIRSVLKDYVRGLRSA